MQSGLKVNYDKSTICVIGPEESNYRMSLHPNFQWLRRGEDFKYLGLSLKLSDEGCLRDSQDNFKFSERTVYESVASLRYAYHSLNGRILLLKTMIASKFVYKFTLSPTPRTAILKQLNKLYYVFVWNNKKPRICREVMEQDPRKGGFNMLNVYKQEKSLKFS